MDTFESIALEQDSRCMTVLAEELDEHYIVNAAGGIARLDKGTLVILTGFYVNGISETDGPAGAFVLAKTAEALGFSPVIITDTFCRDVFEEEDIPVIYAGLKSPDEDFEKILDELRPCAVVSVERCGRNSEGFCGNCRGKDISAVTAPVDVLFEKARTRGILTVGIGDGGNEIGMGNLAPVITEKLGLVPCVVKCDHLIVSTTSNRGAYALSAALCREGGIKLPITGEELGAFITKLVNKGFTDGGTGDVAFRVDGFDAHEEMSRLDRLAALI